MSSFKGSVNPPSHPTTLGDVWIGTTRPDPDALAEMHKPAPDVDLTDEELAKLEESSSDLVFKAVREIRRRRRAVRVENYRQKRIDRLSKAMELIQGKIDALRLVLTSNRVQHAEDEDQVEQLEHDLAAADATRDRLADALNAEIAELRACLAYAFRQWVRHTQNRVWGATEAEWRQRVMKAIGPEETHRVVSDAGFDNAMGGGRHG